MSAWWKKIITEYKEGNPKLIVFDGNIYNICNEESKFMKEFDGKKFIITLFDDTIIMSTNVWFLSKVPTEYENILKNNVKELIVNN